MREGTRMEVHAGLMREPDLERALAEVAENFAAVLGPAAVARSVSAFAERRVGVLFQQPEPAR